MKSDSDHKRPVGTTNLVLTFHPSQLRRKSGLPGGSAAKVFEPRSQKFKSTQQKRGEFFAAHPAGPVFGVSGMSGGAFLWLLSLARQRK
jgi:hypothetical protein